MGRKGNPDGPGECPVVVTELGPILRLLESPTNADRVLAGLARIPTLRQMVAERVGTTVGREQIATLAALEREVSALHKEVRRLQMDVLAISLGEEALP